jgi:hypothetical protein
MSIKLFLTPEGVVKGSFIHFYLYFAKSSIPIKTQYLGGFQKIYKKRKFLAGGQEGEWPPLYVHTPLVKQLSC